MYDQFTSPYNLRLLHELKEERQRQVNPMINSLKIQDVKEDTDFNNISNRIKRSILLEPIQFEEPKFIDHEYDEISLTMQQRLVGGMSKDHYYHIIHIPFKGSPELLEHRPSSFSITSSEHGIILPDGNIIEVTVDLPELNPTRAIEKAESLLSMTFRNAKSNNDEIGAWAVSINQQVDEKLKSKREELIRLFSN